MKGRESVKIKTLMSAALLSSALLWGAAAQAADTLLASEPELELKQGKVTAELWGDRLANGYAHDLLVIVKNKDKKVITAYQPSIKGGYNCQLQLVKPQGEEPAQLLVSAGQGDWRAPSEYRIISFADLKEVQEVFGVPESSGIVTQAELKDGKLQLSLLNGSSESVALDAGVKAEDGRVEYSGLHSLQPWDVDDDGVDELLASQRLTQGKAPLADIGVVWKRRADGEGWEALGTTIMTLAPTAQGNTVNDGAEMAAGTILPRRLVVRGGEATFPVFAGKNVEVQNKINKELQTANADSMKKFFAGQADTAFKVMSAKENLLSVQLICGKTNFVHNYVNINPKTGELIKLSDILNTQDKDLLPLLNVLNTNKKVSIKDLPDEWYIEGRNLFLISIMDTHEEISGFDLGNLHKFILNKQILE